MSSVVLSAGGWSGSIVSNITQWGVGHGGFFTQTVDFFSNHPSSVINKTHQKTLRVIYDCGAGLSKAPAGPLKKSIDLYVKSLNDKDMVDLLAISHYDADHINGLSYLAEALKKKDVKVKEIWAPFLTSSQKLQVILGSRDGGGNSPTSSGGTDPIVANIAWDPVTYLSEYFPSAEVRLIEPGAEPPPSPSEAGRDLPQKQPGEVVLEHEEPKGRIVLAGKGGGGQSSSLEVLWEIVSYVNFAADHAKNIVKSLILKKFNILTLDDLDLTQIHALVQDKAFKAKFNTEVKAALSSAGVSHSSKGRYRTPANISSLCLYSSLADPYTWNRFRQAGGTQVANAGAQGSAGLAPWSVPIPPAWLGTGDAPLAMQQSVDALVSHLGRVRMDRVGIISVPHHGSKYDSGPALWSAIPNVKIAVFETSYNGQVSRGSRHPHATVVAEIRGVGVADEYAIASNPFIWRDTRRR